MNSVTVGFLMCVFLPDCKLHEVREFGYLSYHYSLHYRDPRSGKQWALNKYVLDSGYCSQWVFEIQEKNVSL